MSKARKAAKPESSEPSLKEKLSASFLTAFEADFKTHGIQVIEQLRAEDPGKYVEVGAKLIAAVEQPPPGSGPGDFRDCKSIFDMGRKMLLDNGMPEAALTDQAIEQA